MIIYAKFIEKNTFLTIINIFYLYYFRIVYEQDEYEQSPGPKRTIQKSEKK